MNRLPRPFRVGDSSTFRDVGLCLFALLVASTHAADDYSAWAHQKTLYYNTASDGAGVSGSVVGFPVLVRLTAADFPFAEALGNGQDLRFIKPDGTAMPFEIDRYDSAAGIADVWVLADTVKGNFKGPLMRIYWGNPSAPAASDPGKVFSRANGFAAVWHLGGQYPTARPNAAPGGNDAVPGNYDGNEQVRGVIGYADSLDGGSPGDYLQTWQTFDSLSREFTFSVWAYPTAAASWARFMDFGNGTGKDNLVLGRIRGSDSLQFENWNDTSGSSVAAAGALALGEWQYFVVSVLGKTARIYRNGVEIGAGELKDTIRATPRSSNYMGRGNWPDNAYYRGMIDEPEVSAATRGPDWIKLAYANQRPDQTLLSFQPPVICQARFGVPGDTTVSEGSVLQLSGIADCADQFQWSWVSGPAVRLLDPEVKALAVNLPRVSDDTAIVLRFSARFPDSARSGEVRVAIRNSVPDPQFTLPSESTWNGRDSLLIRPSVANLTALLASPFPVLRYDWKVSGPQVDTVWKADGLSLTSPRTKDDLTISLCLDNGGQPTCASTLVHISDPVGLAVMDTRTTRARDLPGYGADGRFRQGSKGLAIRFPEPDPLRNPRR